MISFKHFVEAVHRAIVGAGDSLMNKNKELLDTYFEKSVILENSKDKELLTPRIVELAYPTLDDVGQVATTTIQVPLVTLVPFTSSRIEKATFTAEFALEVVNNELQISFPGENSFDKGTIGKLEIVISPQEPAEGLDLIIGGYANALKRQIT